MKTNSILLDGKDGNELNQLCSQYDQLKTAYEEAKEAFDNVKNRIKELCVADTETTKFFVKMTVTSDTMILDTAKIKSEYPEIAEQCQKVKKGSRSIKEILKK